MVSGVSTNSGKGGGQLTLTVHHGNIYEWYDPPTLLKVRQGLNHDNQQTLIPGY